MTNEQINRREPGNRVFPSPKRAKLTLVPPAQAANRPAPKVELSPEGTEMLREMNRRHIVTRNTDAPDAA